MRAFLGVTDGGRAGARLPLRPDRVSVLGRAPGVDLQLDPQTDLAVSGRHAEFRFADGSWWIRDLDSRNGTFVDGHRVTGAVALQDGAELQFAVDGPRARFRTGTSDTGEIRRKGRRTLVWTGTGAVVALLVVIGVAALLLRQERADRNRLVEERADLNAVVDSLLEREQQVTGALSELDDLLAGSRSEAARLRDRLQSSDDSDTDGSEELADVQRQLEEVTQTLARQQLAASLDFDRIERMNRPAVAMIFVENADGRVVSGTGFSVSDDALLVTSRHLFENAAGDVNPARIAVQFADSRQVWPGELVQASGTADLAVIRAGPIAGSVPVVRGIGSERGPLQSGAPVAVLGFPLGGSFAPEPGGDGQRPPARPLLSAGVVSEVDAAEYLVQGYGEPGASGSPVFDEDGRVVGVVQGGERGERGGVLVVVPVSQLLALLEAADIPVP